MIISGTGKSSRDLTEKKFQNILKTPTGNLLQKIKNKTNRKTRPKIIKNSKHKIKNKPEEIYTFGENERVEETQQNYDLPSPISKKISTDNNKSFKELADNKKDIPMIELCNNKKLKNIFADSFQSNPMSKGKNSPSNTPRDFNITPLQLPINFGQTFGDQPITKDSGMEMILFNSKVLKLQNPKTKKINYMGIFLVREMLAIQ